MITKISSNEYLRRVDNMDVADRGAYLNRVGEWLKRQTPMLLRKMDDPTAVFQNAMQCSAGWNDAECAAWNEGARLLTAMVGKADTWLPDMLYTKSAKRAIRQMVEVLRTGSMFNVQGSSDQGRSQGSSASGKTAGQQTKHAAKEEPAEKTRKGTQAVAAAPASKPQSTETNLKPQTSNLKPEIVRPKHIDQYVHLLPESTQKKAATVQGLLRDLDVAREKMRLLMDDPKASADSRAQWAKTATKLDEKVKTIYKELDAEWEKLVQSGRVVVDDLGNARVMEPAVAQQGTQPNAEAEAKAAEENAKRIEYLKKWLRDTRTKASDERKEQWEQNCKELLSLGGELTDSIRKAAEVYGVNLDEITK